MTELILISAVVLLSEVLILEAFKRCLELRWGDGDRKGTLPETSREGEFWRNIISYDHKKGGEKD